MGNAGNKISDGLHFLGLLELIFNFFLLGDIPGNSLCSLKKKPVWRLFLIDSLCRHTEIPYLGIALERSMPKHA